MGLKFSLNIFLSKLRAIYALRVKPVDYDQLISCKSLVGLLKILKERKFYFEALRNIPDNLEALDISEVERALEFRFLDILENIAKYDRLLGGIFSNYISSYIDVKFMFIFFDSILKAKRGGKLLYAGSGRNIVFKNSKLKKLPEAKDFKEFFEIVSGAGYKNLFRDLDLSKEYFFIQNFFQKKLYEDLYDKLLTGICKIKRGRSRKELFSVFSCYLELRSFVFSVRAKKMNDRSLDFLPSFKNFEQKIISKLGELNLESEYFELLNSSYLASQIKEIKYNYLEQLPEKFLLLKCKKNMHFSLDPAVVVLSFIFLLRIEIQNIVKIIEGIRYGLLQNKIKEVLVL